MKKKKILPYKPVMFKQGDNIFVEERIHGEDYARLDTAVSAVFLATMFLLCVTIYCLFRVSFVMSGSMVPTLSVGEIGLVRTVFGPDDLRRGDIVVFDPITVDNYDNIEYLAPNGEAFIKRLVGLPGERIRIENDVVYINGEPLDEPYAVYPNDRMFGPEDNNMEEFTIPEGQYFFMGDNRDHSYDSRYGLKTIPYENIHLKMMFHVPTLAARYFGTTNNDYFINGGHSER